MYISLHVSKVFDQRNDQNSYIRHKRKFEITKIPIIIAFLVKINHFQA